MAEPTVFTLTDPIETYEGTITELKLKTPRAKLFNKYGSPYSVIREGDEDNPRLEFKFNTKAMFAFVSDMSGVGPEHLEDMSGVDVQPLFWEVVNILGQRPTKSKT